MNNTSTTTRTPKDAAKALLRAQSENDLDVFVALLAPEFVGSGSFAGERIGKEVYVKLFESFHQSFLDVKMEPTTMLSEGDAVAREHVESATFKAPWVLPGGHTLAPTNRSYLSLAAGFLRVNAQGLTMEQGHYGDRQGWSQQLGVDPKVFVPQTKVVA